VKSPAWRSGVLGFSAERGDTERVFRDLSEKRARRHRAGFHDLSESDHFLPQRSTTTHAPPPLSSMPLSSEQQEAPPRPTVSISDRARALNDRLCGLELQYAPAAQQADRDVVLVKKSGQALAFALVAMQDDKEIVIAAVNRGGSALQHASDAMRANPEVVLAAMRRNGCALQHASDVLRNDRRVVLFAVRQNGDALAHASDDLRGDVEVVLAAMRAKRRSFRHALRRDALARDPRIIATNAATPREAFVALRLLSEWETPATVEAVEVPGCTGRM
jgi:hypothetical protein